MDPQDKQPQPNQPLNQPEPNQRSANDINPPSTANQSIHIDQIGASPVNSPINQRIHDLNQQHQQPQAQNLFTKKRAFYRRLWFWLLILIALLLGWVGYSYFVATNDSPVSFFKILNINSLKANSPTNTSSNKTTNLAQSTIIDATAGWKTYSDKDKIYKIKATFKYPSDWKLGPINDCTGNKTTTPPTCIVQTLASPDWSMSNNSSNSTLVKSGSLLVITYSNQNSKEQSLDNICKILTKTNQKCEYITLSGIKAIKVNNSFHHTISQGITAMTSSGWYYSITQAYNDASDNPYPHILYDVIATLKIN